MIKYYDNLEKLSFLYYIDDDEKEHSYILPNAFFITGDGVLYRAVSNNGDPSLNKCFKIVEDIIYDRKFTNSDGSSNYLDINDLLDKEIKKYYEITKNRKVSLEDANEYLNLNHSISDRGMDLALETVLGNISARIDVYKFFRDLLTYTNNPKEEYEKLLKMCNNDYCDILVRCCGFNKIEIRNYHEITTSDLDYEENLFEYTIKNWHVSFIPPIGINRSNGTIEDKKDNIYVKRLMYGF